MPQQPYVVERVAIQFESRGDRIIRYTMDNRMENRWIKNIDYRTFVSLAIQFLREFGIREECKKLVIPPIFCIFITEKQYKTYKR